MAIYVLGSNFNSQLGLGSDANSSHIPRRLTYFDNISIRQVSCGLIHTCVLDNDGVLYSWGCNDDFALGRDGDESIPDKVNLKEKVIKVKCGSSFTICLTDKGYVYGWGTFRDHIGIAGFDEKVKFQKTPKKIKIRNIIDIEVGHNHVLMLDSKGIVYSMGTSPFGQLGYHVLARKRCYGLRPRAVNNLRGKNKKIQKIFCGGSHSFIKDISSDVYGWGKNSEHELLNDETGIGYKKLKANVPNIDYIRAGMEHTLFIDGKKDLYVIGRNSGNQLGVDIKITEKPIKLLENVDEIALNSGSTLARIGNKLYGWGPNYSGEIGFEDERIKVPQKLEYDFGNIFSINIGNDFSVIHCDKKE